MIDCGDPGEAIGAGDFLGHLLLEVAEVGMGGVGGSEGVPLPDEGSGPVRQFRDEVGDMALGDGVGCGLQEDLPVDFLASFAGARWGELGEIRFRLLEEVVPSGPPEVKKGVAGERGER